MSDIKEFKNKKSIEEEAADWVIKIDGETLSDIDQEVFANWLKNPSHKKVFIELARCWGNLDVLQQVTEAEKGEDSSVSSVEENNDINDENLLSVDFTKGKSTGNKIAEARLEDAAVQVSTRKLRRAYTFVAASFTLITVLLLVHFSQFGSNQQPASSVAVYRTHIGEQRDLRLSDGSRIKLNTDSVVKVDFSDRQRTIYLQRGEVNFIVAKDKYRPFVVYVGKGSVTAVGTEFNVKFQHDITDVVVTEGIVKVSASATSGISTGNALEVPKNALQSVIASVVAGQKARFDTQKISEIRDIDPASLERALAWHSGMLSFADTPLSEVINDVSRYTNTEIVIDDPEIAKIPVAGYFKAGEINAMMEVLQLGFGIKVTHLANNKILLSKNDHIGDH